MKRRIYLFVALITILIALTGIPAAAQSGRTFYIDYANGSNANNGTSTAAAWKSHPFMQTAAACTGTGSVPAYSHQAGDRFIFKGGVSWPAACFIMELQAGGTSGNPDYYGVQAGWGTGRVVFDLNNTIPTASSGNYNVIRTAHSYVTFDSIEIYRQRIPRVGESQGAAVATSGIAWGSVTLTNFYIHGWNTTIQFTDALGGPTYDEGGVDGQAVLDHSEIDGSASYAYNSTGNQITVGFGGSCHNCGVVSNSKIHDTMAACFSVGQCHDNEFYNISQAIWNTATPTGFDLHDWAPIYANPHTQVVENNAGVSGWNLATYNNLIHDNPAGVTISMCPGDPVYNNVIWNSNQSIMFDSNCANATTSTPMDVYNNTVSCGANCFRFSWRSNGLASTLNLKNNHWITAGTPTCYNNESGGCNNVTTVNASNNITMTPSTATSQGYTKANKYQPTYSGGGTVNAGTSLAGLCSGNVSALCSDILGVARPQGAAWDVGAYEFKVSSASGGTPPSGLVAVVQ